jgi:hypothetical protein
MAATLFILQRGAHLLSPAPVWAESCQSLIGMWLFALREDSHIQIRPFIRRNPEQSVDVLVVDAGTPQP